MTAPPLTARFLDELKLARDRADLDERVRALLPEIGAASEADKEFIRRKLADRRVELGAKL